MNREFCEVEDPEEQARILRETGVLAQRVPGTTTYVSYTPGGSYVILDEVPMDGNIRNSRVVIWQVYGLTRGDVRRLAGLLAQEFALESKCHDN